MTDSPRAFVCGNPIAHSRSPLIHRWWLERYGLRGSYDAIERRPDEVGAFIRGLGQAGLVGGNITIPHKEAALEACDSVDEVASLIGAVNTVWLDDGRLRGANTDAYGFLANLDERAPGWDSARTAIILGAGGAARAVIHAMQERGIGDIRIVNRTKLRALELKDRFGGAVSAHEWSELRELLSDCEFLVNTTSLGMEGHEHETVEIGRLPSRAIVTDIVYTPLITPLLAASQARDLPVVDGLGMLLHQAVPGFERWFGKRPEVTIELREHIEMDLRP